MHHCMQSCNLIEEGLATFQYLKKTSLDLDNHIDTRTDYYHVTLLGRKHANLGINPMVYNSKTKRQKVKEQNLQPSSTATNYVIGQCGALVNNKFFCFCFTGNKQINGLKVLAYNVQRSQWLVLWRCSLPMNHSFITCEFPQCVQWILPFIFRRENKLLQPSLE